MKPLLILESPLSGRFIATRAYRWIDKEKGQLLVTGHKEDVTDQIESIIAKRLAKPKHPEARHDD
jgi:hypothetical protein